LENSPRSGSPPTALGDDVVVLALVLKEELDQLIQSSSVSDMRPSKPSISEASRNVSLFPFPKRHGCKTPDELAL
jgi:hypothetical protein